MTVMLPHLKIFDIWYIPLDTSYDVAIAYRPTTLPSQYLDARMIGPNNNNFNRYPGESGRIRFGNLSNTIPSFINSLIHSFIESHVWVENELSMLVSVSKSDYGKKFFNPFWFAHWTYRNETQNILIRGMDFALNSAKITRRRTRKG